MTRDVPESDWKLFRKLRESALDRFCERILREVAELSAAPNRTFHERYLDVYKRVDLRDDELARAFNGASRSRMINQLAQMRALDLIEDEELAKFSVDTRSAAEVLAGRSK